METIVAPVTSTGQSAVAIIRVSGERAKSIVALFLQQKLDKARYVYTCDFNDAEGKTVDHLCAVFFKGPASFTGEDVVELYTHASDFIVKRIIACLCQAGAQMAQAGEFSRRAYFNGKMSLEQVQAIPDLLQADNQLAHDIAMTHLQGKLSKHIQEIKHEFLSVLAQIEGSIDFPEEVPEINRKEFREKLKNRSQQISEILEKQAFGRILQRGPKVLIMGPPNVGKSSLFNLLLGESRALVSDQAGTTRDFLEARVSYNGSAYLFYDCAGIHETTEKIEKAGIEKISTLVTKADLCLWVHDQSQPITEEDQQSINKMIENKGVLHVYNKADLSPSLMADSSHNLHLNSKKAVFISCLNRSGIEDLFMKIDTYFNKEKILNDLDFICSIRQEESLRRVNESLNQLCQQSEELIFDDLLVIELKQLMMHCEDFHGDSLHEEVLDDIFSRFCVGK